MAVALKSTGLVAEVVESVSAALADIGFTRRQAGGVFTVDISAESVGWLGLNRATKHLVDAVEVNPVVGVRHERVERLVAELRAEKFHEFLPPTVSGPLGYLMPEGRYVGWRFEPGSVGDTAAELASAVEQFALPVMRSTDDLDALRRKIEEGWGYSNQLVFRLPVVCWLQGDMRATVEALDRAVGELDDRSDAAAQELRSFVERFRALISGGH